MASEREWLPELGELSFQGVGAEVAPSCRPSAPSSNLWSFSQCCVEMHSKRFTRAQRLRVATDFAQLVRQPKIRVRVATYMWLARPHALLDEKKVRPARLGILIARRALKSSVARSRIKRRVRELFRLHPPPQGWDLVFRAFPGVHPEDSGLLAQYGRVCQKLATSTDE